MSTDMNNVSEILATMTPEQKTAFIANTIQEWRKAEKKLADAKAEEIRLRNLAILLNFPNHTDADEGTQNAELGNGYKLKAVFKQNYNLADGDAVDAALTKMESLGAEGTFLAERIVKWKPELSLSEYRKLEPQYKAIVDTVLTTKPGQASLEFVEPKSKK